MGYDLISKVYNNELWLDDFIYPTTGKRVIRFETFNEDNGLSDTIKEISVSTFRKWVKDFYETHPKIEKKTTKEWITTYSVAIPTTIFLKKLKEIIKKISNKIF